MAAKRWLTFIFLLLRIFSHGGRGSVRATFVHKCAAPDFVHGALVPPGVGITITEYS